jgi:uncharacterized repeat protein (TIGR03803 family)
LVVRVGLLILPFWLVAVTANAQIFTVLGTFDGSNGEYPQAGLTLSGNTLYGTTQNGGNLSLNEGLGDGTVFSVPVSGGSPTVLATFNDSNGACPVAGLTLSGNTLYGTTAGGGADAYGTVFSVPMSGGNPTVLASFNFSDGEEPYAGVTLSGNTLYGTTEYGGANRDGTVFSVPVSGGNPTVLASFNAAIRTGTNPMAGVTLIGNTLYGTTRIGGANACGTVFSLPVSGGSPTVLAWFNIYGSTGKFPQAGLTLNGNTLYGTTAAGGANGYGAVFSIPASGGNLTLLASFDGSNGSAPVAGLILSGNTLYGTTSQGGAYGYGTVFSVPVSGGNPTVLVSFDGSNGLFPQAGLILSNNVLYGTTAGSGPNGGTVFAINIAPATIALSSNLNATIITGGTGAVGMTVSNSPSSAYNLNYTLAAAVLGGSATFGAMTSGTGSLAPSASQACAVSATSTNLGVNTISLTASDPNSSNLSQMTTATLTVYDHSNASLSSSASQMTQTINFGNVLRGANVPSQSFTIYNLAANTSAAYTANLKLTGFATSGDPAFQTNLAPFGGLTAGYPPAGGGSNGNPFTASLNTANYTTTGINTVTMSAAQLVDDSTLSGAGGNNNGAMTVTLQGNVGNATADNSNSQTAFGPALIAAVAPNASYANLESKTTATSGSGGQGMVDTTATILAGTNSSGSAQTVGMAWRTQTQGEIGSGVISDIVQLSGFALNGSSGQTAPFVMQMSYDSDVLPGTSAADDPLYLAWLDPATGQWVHAVDGNVGINSGNFEVGAYPSGDTTLGDWGVNTANQTVWAVVNHDGDYAVVPEPSTLVLLGAGAVGMLGWGWRQRKLQRRF